MASPGRGNPPSVQVEGTVVPALDNRLASMLVEETAAGLYRCELTFGNWQPASEDYLFFDRTILDFGKEMIVQMGEYDGAPVIFQGKITAIEGHFPQGKSPQVIVLLEDGLQDLRMTRHTRTFANMTDAQIMTQVAGDYFSQTSISITGPTYAFLAQVNQSDLAFLRERARAVGVEVWVDQGSFSAKSRTDRAVETVSLVYGETLQEFSALADLADQRTKVVLTGWDTTTKQAITTEATSSVISSEVSGMTDGGSVLQTAFGERVEQLVHTAPVAEDEAKAMVNATYERLARRFVTGTGQAMGDARIRVGIHLDIDGLGTLFNGTYYVTEVRHTYTEQTGYVTQFRVERAGIGG